MRCNRFQVVLALAAAMFALAATTQAGSLWQVADGDWNTAANWSAGLPTAVDAIVDNDGIARISANFTTSREVGIGFSGVDNVDAGNGGSGTVYQTAGTLDVNGGRFSLGNNGNVGIYYLEGGTLDAIVADAIIGRSNSSAASASGIIQSGSSISKYKKMFIGYGYGNGQNGSKGFYEMNSSGTMVCNQYELGIANGSGSGEIGVFTQTAGTVTLAAGGNSGLRMGAGAGAGGQAIINLDGGTFYAKLPLLFSQPAGTAGVYIDIDGGTLKLDGTWNWTSLDAVANSDWRSHGVQASTGNLVFEQVGGVTNITAVAPGIKVLGNSQNWGLTVTDPQTEPDTLELLKEARDTEPFSTTIEVTRLDLMDQINIIEQVFNATDKAWTDYHLLLEGEGELGFGTWDGSEWAGSLVDGSDGKELQFVGGPLALGDTLDLDVWINLPDGPDPYTFTLTQWPTYSDGVVIPEPTTIAVWSLLGLCWASMSVWRRRGRHVVDMKAMPARRRGSSEENRVAIRRMLDRNLTS